MPQELISTVRLLRFLARATVNARQGAISRDTALYNEALTDLTNIQTVADRRGWPRAWDERRGFQLHAFDKVSLS
jgi:hypothetical protein